MFDAISGKIQAVFRKLGIRGTLTEANIREGLQEVRLALLQADVNYQVVREFIGKVQARAVGQEVLRSVTPAQQIVKIVHDELVALMGPADPEIPFAAGTQTVIMLAGLQGSGKTTTCAKLAKIVQKKGRQPLLVAADLKRPAAVEQLVVLGQQIQVPVYAEEAGRPPKVCERALAFAKENGRDVVILDTAGRLHIDRALMDELKDIAARVKPRQVYLVCDAMTGQDAVNSAKEFDAQLAIDGVILTKLDGDARGGAALSVRAVTGKPIKFVGVGEKIENLEPFHPDRMASRILGMGDVVSLVEKAQELVSREEAEDLQSRMMSGGITFEDFLKNFQRMKKLGSFRDILSHIPGLGTLGAMSEEDEKELRHMEAIVQSMTTAERRRPEIINASRRIRIARGSGTTVAQVNSLLRQFEEIRRMMAAGLQGMKGGHRMPPGRMPGPHRRPPRH